MTEALFIAVQAVFGGAAGRRDKGYIDARDAEIAAGCIAFAEQVSRGRRSDGRRMTAAEFERALCPYVPGTRSRFGSASKLRMHYEFTVARAAGWTPTVVDGLPAVVSPNGSARLRYAPNGRTQVTSHLEANR